MSGRINAMVHTVLSTALRPGVTTKELANTASRWIHQLGGVSSLAAVGFPEEICISINDEVGHGVPSDRTIRPGDLVKIDISLQYKGLHTDCAVTHVVGGTDLATLGLVRTTKKALANGIAQIQSGARVSNISNAIFKTFLRTPYEPVRKAFGHGIGRELHESPMIANFGPPHHGPKLRSGMALAVEPVAIFGKGLTIQADNGWTDTALNHNMSAHFEHTVLVTEYEPEILTTLPDGLAKQEIPFGSTFVPPHVQPHPYRAADREILLILAATEMDSILMDAWGRRVNPDEFLGPEGAQTVVLKDALGHIAGFFVYFLYSSSLFLHTLVISGTFQGQGLGTKVMQYLDYLAEAFGRTAVELNVQVNNRKALMFYQGLGFEPASLPFANSLLMRKSLWHPQ